MEVIKQSVTVEEGVQLILEHIGCTEIEMVPAAEAAGRILAENLISPENIPPFRRSPLDGYSFRAEDTLEATKEDPVILEIIEEIPAGKAPEHTVGKGQAVKILTGAPIPEGADVVEKFEVVEADETTLKLFHPYKSNENVVPVGEDIQTGDPVLSAGTEISPAYLGILAGLGFAELPVYKKPLVYLISTGSELVPIDAPIPLGKIRNSSIYTLKAFLEQEGAEVKIMPIVKDDKIAIAEAIRKAAAESDIIFTTGGVSVGDYDMLIRSMQYLEADILYWKLAMKPGSAFLASIYQGKPVISLSGNPASATISMFMIGIPALRKLTGRTDYMLETCELKLLEGFPKKSGMRRFIPGRLQIKGGDAYITITPAQGNGILHPLHGCNVIVDIPAGSPAQAPGAMIKAYLL